MALVFKQLASQEIFLDSERVGIKVLQMHKPWEQARLTHQKEVTLCEEKKERGKVPPNFEKDLEVIKGSKTTSPEKA